MPEFDMVGHSKILSHEDRFKSYKDILQGILKKIDIMNIKNIEEMLQAKI